MRRLIAAAMFNVLCFSRLRCDSLSKRRKDSDYGLYNTIRRRGGKIAIYRRLYENKQCNLIM